MALLEDTEINARLGELSGWQRSFSTANGDTFNLEHYLHLYSHHVRACGDAGLTITAVAVGTSCIMRRRERSR